MDKKSMGVLRPGITGNLNGVVFRVWDFPEGRIRVFHGPMVVYEDGDPDPLPEPWTSYRELISTPHTKPYGWWARWESQESYDPCGSFLGPFDDESTAITMAQDDAMASGAEPFDPNNPNHEAAGDAAEANSVTGG